MITVIVVNEKPNLDFNFTNQAVIEKHKGKINSSSSLFVARNTKAVSAYNEISICHIEGVKPNVYAN